MNLVVGSTGFLGSEICRLLAEAGKPVKALVRTTSDPAKVANLKSMGASIVQGDLRDAASLKAACQGVGAVIVTAASIPFAYQPDGNTPATTDRDGVLNLIAAAEEAGVQRFVYTSFPSGSIQFPLQDAKRAVEARLSSGKLIYTVLQANLFIEGWLSPAVGFDYPNHKAAICGNGDNRIDWVSFFDVARIAVASLDTPAAFNTILPVGGPQAISPMEVVKIFEQVGGKPFEVSHIPIEALQAQFDAATDAFQKTSSGLMIILAQLTPMDLTVTRKAFPFKLRSVEDYARGVMAQGSV
jgi:uncharacterized protein YbjT (DUF2867 family)